MHIILTLVDKSAQNISCNRVYYNSLINAIIFYRTKRIYDNSKESRKMAFARIIFSMRVFRTKGRDGRGDESIVNFKTKFRPPNVDKGPPMDGNA